MTLDPEEFKRRREAHQQKQYARQRKAIVNLIVAVIALALCGVLIYTFVRSGTQTPTPTQPSQTPSETLNDAQTDTTNATEPTTVIHLAAAGDLNVTDAVLAAGGPNYDYSNVFLDIAHLLADAHLTTLNFEGTLCGAPYNGETASAPQSLAGTLSSIGVDYLQLANSYAIHQGLSGLKTTIQSVRDSGMEPLGVYADSQEFKSGKGYSIRYVSGIRIAFVSFTKGMDGLALPANGADCVNVLYTDYASTYQEVDTEGISSVLDAVAEEQPDVTVALLHWGSEFNDTISSSQLKIRDLMLEKGVDAIIGTHSHYVQKMEFDPEAGTFVAYSLGDFAGNADRPGSEYSVILNLEITRDNNTGVTKITNYDYTPIFIAVEENAPLRILRIKEAISAYESGYIDRVSQANYEAMKYALDRIESRIKGE